jgi:hypothetical protein
MKSRLLLLPFLLTNMCIYAQNAFTEHLINQPLSNPVQVQSADIDGDGDKDFAVVSSNGELTWHEQITSTSFKTHYISMDIKGFSLEISDLDKDSKLDIVVTYSNNGTGEVSWFKNDGNQNFSQSVLSNSNIASSTSKTIVVDIDNDNDKDIISSMPGVIRILRNDGNENFTNESTNINLGNGSLSENTNDIEIIDFDNDGLLDFLVATRGADGVNWYKQNNDNTFSNNSLLSGTFVNISVGDLDGDNDLDIIVIKDSNTSGTGNEIIVYKNDGDNQNFTLTSVHSVNPALNTGIKHIKLFDADNDNDLDLVYFSGESSNKGLKIRLNNSGDFSNLESDIYLSDLFTDEIGSSNFVNFILEDINLDNKIDIVQVNGAIGRINYYQNNDINLGTNNFSLTEVSNSAGNVDGISVADLNNDNKLDIIASSSGEYTIEWFNNSGDNVNYSANKIDFLPKTNYSKNKITDIDGDGFLDILSVNEASSNLGGFYWYKNNGDETFSTNLLQTINNGGETPKNINYADFDNDGDIDILTITSSKINILTNDGNDNFTTNEIFSRSLSGLYTVEIYDVDNDNLLDIIFSGNGDILGYLKNNGANSFSTFINFVQIDNTDVQINPSTFKFTDIDNDNDIDIISISGNLTLLKNDGTGKYEVNTLVSSSQFGSGRDLEIVDIDNDGDKDIIVGGGFGVYWAKNDNNIFTRELIVNNDNSTNSNSFAVEIADMDNDGDSDIVYSSYTGNKVAWLENKIDETLSNNSFTFSESSILVYPNPTEGFLKINSTEKINHILIYDTLGKVVYQKKSNELDLSHLPKGLYFVQINTENNNILTRKILKK